MLRKTKEQSDELTAFINKCKDYRKYNLIRINASKLSKIAQCFMPDRAHKVEKAKIEKEARKAIRWENEIENIQKQDEKGGAKAESIFGIWPFVDGSY